MEKNILLHFTFDIKIKMGPFNALWRRTSNMNVRLELSFTLRPILIIAQHRVDDPPSENQATK